MDTHIPLGKAIHRAFCGDKDPKAVSRYLATLPHGTTFYCKLTTAPTKVFLASKISKVRCQNQTRRTQNKADNLTEYRQMISATFEKKQYGRIIKLLTGEFSPQLVPHDFPGLVGEHLTNSIKSLQAASVIFKRHYSLPLHHQGPLHHDNAV
jgi:hypothetical protein